MLFSNCNKKLEMLGILLEALVSQKLNSLVLLMKQFHVKRSSNNLLFPVSLPLFEFIIYLEQCQIFLYSWLDKSINPMT